MRTVFTTPLMLGLEPLELLLNQVLVPIESLDLLSPDRFTHIRRFLVFKEVSVHVLLCHISCHFIDIGPASIHKIKIFDIPLDILRDLKLHSWDNRSRLEPLHFVVVFLFENLGEILPSIFFSLVLISLLLLFN